MTEQRLIDANELITAFPCGETVRTECVRATIGHMPTIEERKTGKWIPCSERLPDYDDYDEVITTVNGRHGNVEYINGVCTNVQYDDIHELWYINDVYEPNITVTAWMPLPQPYKEAGHE